jgi:16S rRNA (guanine527-N7)-methyltransferase
VTEDGPAAVKRVADVSRETLEQLGRLVDLIRRWNVAENLVAPADLPQLWTRHIADCAQLPGLVPGARRWVDIGSGAGLPGLVIALVAPPGSTVDLIESNQRKCAFLRQAIRDIGIDARVHQGRAETILANWSGPVDCVTARAVAPLSRLLSVAEPLLRTGAVGLFPKGRHADNEIVEAAHDWDFDLVKHPSRIDPDATILEVRNVRRKGMATRG